MPVSIDEVSKDFMSANTIGGGIMGEVMNLDDFLDELSDQGNPNPPNMFNPPTNMQELELSSYHQHRHFNYPPNVQSHSQQPLNLPKEGILVFCQ